MDTVQLQAALAILKASSKFCAPALAVIVMDIVVEIRLTTQHKSLVLGMRKCVCGNVRLN